MNQSSEYAVPMADGMPAFGLGTWTNDDHDRVAESVRTALEVGYRHVDTAQAYGNEAGVGDGVATAAVDREDAFLATKVWTENLSHDDVVASTERSIDRLGTDYIDLLYVHWPAGRYDPEGTFSAFEELCADGRIERIGVSNFEPEHLDRATEVLGETPFVDQVEMHPLLPQPELRAYAEDRGVELVAYSPLARGAVFEVPELNDVAEKHGVSEAQVSLAWLRTKGVTAIPKATGEDHVRDNWESLGLELDEEDVERIDAIDRTDRRIDPSFAPW